MKYYDQGKPIFRSTQQCVKREANEALQKAEGKIAEGQRESPKIHQTRFEDLERDASPATINCELDCLHRMMVLGERKAPPTVGHIPHFPKLREDNVREGFFQHDEFLTLRAIVPLHIKVAMTIAYYTGMRKREIIGINGLR